MIQDQPVRLPKIIFTDYDGTIKPRHGWVAQADIKAFEEFGRLGLVRVVATGRSLYAFHRDWPKDLQIDYLIFSSGLGLCSWTPQGPGPLISSQTLTEKQAASALEASIALKRGFFAFEPPPDCHRFLYQDPIGHPPTSGYLDRLKIYQNVAAPYKEGKPLGPRGQFLITAPKDEMPKVRQDFEKMTEDLSIFYSTSPFGDASLWLEIFPNGVNKGSAARNLTISLGRSPQDTLAIGNDFNDLDMLAFASQSFVTADASLPVRSMYPNLPASSQAPMAHLLNLLSR